MSRGFRDALLRLRERPDDYASFARETREVWEKFARYLARRWKLPLGVDEADVVQELQFAGWLALGRWDPERGKGVDEYVRYNAIDKAKKWLHKQRDSYRRDGSAPSRAPTVFSAFERPDDEPGSAQDRIAWVGPSQEEAVLAADLGRELAGAFGALADRLPFREREALAAVAACSGSLDEAAGLISRDRALCLALRVGSDDEAESVVRRSVSRALEMIAAQGGPDQ